MSKTRRSGRVTMMLLVFALGVSRGALGADAELPVAPAPKETPTVDGDLGDPCWQAALLLKLDGFCDRGRREKGDKPGDSTEARALADGENLYLAFRCRESHPEGPWTYRNDKLRQRGNSHVMGGDYVAVAVDMGRFGFYNYYMFIVNPDGELYRCFTWPHRYDLVLRDIALPAAQSAARIDKAAGQWSVELKVPLKEMLRYPSDGFPSVIGLDLRRVQWGAERGKDELDIYWTGMANVTGNKIKPQYDHMATWKPLFDNYPEFPDAYASGRGWVQLVFPESFGHIRLQAGTVQNKLVSGGGSRLHGLIGTRTSWYRIDETRARMAKLFDAPRMEYWDDLRPAEHPKDQPVVVSAGPVGKPGVVPRFIEKPRVTTAGNETRISFSVSVATDVAVAVLDGGGKIVRHLAAGVLGVNPPRPFEPNKLAQTLTWDHSDDFGKPVGPGQYKVTVSLGLQPRFDHAIPLDKENWWYQDPTPTAKGLDVENLPDPKLGQTLGHFSQGTISYLGVDRDREEVYVQTQHVYDGRTGKKLRDVRPEGPSISDISKGPRTGEMFVARGDGLLHMTGPNEVWRFDRDGKPAPFAAVGRNFIPELWGAHSNPHRGICVGLDGAIYKMHHYIPHTAMENQVSRIGPDGRIRDYGFIEIRALAAGVRVDREGNVYVGCVIQPPDGLPPKELAAKMPDRPRELFKRVYGSVVKFGPAGGIIRPDPEGKLACPAAKGMQPFVAEGAKWVHPGFSPMLSRISDQAGGPGCSCRNGRFDLDDYARLFIPDAVSGRVEVTDSNANTICLVGRRGEPDPASGVEFGWATQVAASDEAIYVADYLRFRVVRIRLDYQASEAAAVQVKGR